MRARRLLAWRAGGLSRPAEGVALLAGLILLMAISLLALVAAGSMLQQQRMATNFTDGQRADRLAEAALRQAEEALFALGEDQRLSDCTTACFAPAAQVKIYENGALPPYPEQQPLQWWQAWARMVSLGESTPTIDSALTTFSPDPPYFLIEEIHFQPADDAANPDIGTTMDGIGYYRVLARASGMGAGSVAVHESILARPWGTGLLRAGDGSTGFGPCAALAAWMDCGRLSWRRRR